VAVGLVASDPALDVHRLAHRSRTRVARRRSATAGRGPDELQQLKNYAPAIAKDPRFDLQRTRWEFWVVSTEVRGIADDNRRQYPDQFGLASTLHGGWVRIWVKTWGEILHDAPNTD